MGKICTNNKGFFEVISLSPDFVGTYKSIGGEWQPEPKPFMISNGPAYNVFYNDKKYQFPHDWPTRIDSWGDLSKSEVKMESVSFSGQNLTLVDVIGEANYTDENRVSSVTVGRILDKAEIIFNFSPNIGGGTYEFEFSFIQNVPNPDDDGATTIENLVEKFSVKNKGSVQKVVEVFVGKKVDVIKVKRVANSTTSNSWLRVVGSMDLYYR